MNAFRSCLFLLLTVVWACLRYSASAASEPAAKPNVILVMTDDQGYGDLSCHGNPVLRTPNLDRLHNQSIRLTEFHVAPMCTPTRGQLMSGVDALRNGAMNVSSGRTMLRREFNTMADAFGAGGYRTGLFGKWHLGDNYPYRPQDRGFQESIWLPSSHTPSASDYWNNDYFDDVYYHNGARKPFNGYCTDVFFREAIAWMRECSQQKKPFFCYLALNAPHGPLFVPDRYRKPYQDQKRPIASFFGMIANIDENIGRLDAFLREAGLSENTILIFMTDNGTATGESVFNAGMRGKKIDLYDGGHRVPFFLRWPVGKLRAPGDVAALAQAQDVLPTLIDLCGLEKPRRPACDGISLASLLRGQTNNLPERKLVVQFSRMNQPRPRKGDAAVLWKTWRLVTNKELYDISTDPGQQTNIIDRFPEIALNLRRHYEDWWQALEARVHEFSPIHIGSNHENPSVLTPCDWQDVFLDQQAQIRRVRRNGTWTVFVERDGSYEFALRRWPIEADAAITAGVPEYKGVDGIYPAGEALPIHRARLKVAEIEKSAPVSPDDKEIRFSVSLTRGQCELRTAFDDADGKEICGAYHLHVRAMD